MHFQRGSLLPCATRTRRLYGATFGRGDLMDSSNSRALDQAFGASLSQRGSQSVGLDHPFSPTLRSVAIAEWGVAYRERGYMD